MNILSLLEASILTVIKSKNIKNVQFLLDLNLLDKTTQFLLAHLPLNHVFCYERQLNNCQKFYKFWKLVVENCALKSSIFKKNLLYSIDVFELEEFDQRSSCEQLYHHRQVLINMLFLEALYELYDCNSSTAEISNMPTLHKALNKNYPDIDLFNWLLTLSNEINSIKIHSYHFQIFCKYQTLFTNVIKSTDTIDFISLPSNWYKDMAADGIDKYDFINKLIAKSCARKLTIKNVCFLWNCIKTLYFSNLTFKSCIFCDCSNRIEEPSDIWDSAIKNSCDDLFFYQDVDDLYSDLDDKSTLLSKSNLKLTKNVNVISELVIQFSDLDSCDLSSMKNVLPYLIFIKKLGIDLSSSNNLGQMKEIINILSKLIINSLSKLSVISFTGFTFMSTMFLQIVQSLNNSFEKRNFVYEKLAFIDCVFLEDCSDFNFDLLKKTNEISSIVQTLYLCSVVFATESVYGFYTKFVKFLSPSYYCINGYCFYGSQIFANLIMLRDAILFASTLPIFTLKKIILALPRLLTEKEEDMFCQTLTGLNIDHFFLLHSEEFEISAKIINTLRKYCSDVAVLKKNISKNMSMYSREDYISIM